MSPIPGPGKFDWSELAARERASGICPGDPYMVDPECRVDARLTRYFGRSGFARLARSTKVSYTNDYRVFFQLPVAAWNTLGCSDF